MGRHGTAIRLHGTAMVSPWHHHGTATCHGTEIAVLQKSISVPWKCYDTHHGTRHRSGMAMLQKAMAAPWKCYDTCRGTRSDTAMVSPWHCRLPWWCHKGPWQCHRNAISTRYGTRHGTSQRGPFMGGRGCTAVGPLFANSHALQWL